MFAPKYLTAALTMTFTVAGAAHANLVPGLISDFNDGTRQGWVPPKENTTNVNNYLQVEPAPQLAAFTQDVAGTIDPAVTAIQVDLMRPNGEADLPMRLVLFGPGTTNRWTSTDFQTVPGDGTWNTYTFSILEADLTQALGSATYADLAGDLNRLLFRVDGGAPDLGGEFGFTGVFNMDNVIAVPEPASAALLAIGAVAMASRRRGRQ